MAATFTKEIQDTCGRSGGILYQKTINYDTADEVFEVAEAVSLKRWYVTALNYGFSSSHNIKLYSGVTETAVYNHASGAASKDAIFGPAFMMTNQNESLSISSSVTGTITITYTDNHALAAGELKL